MNNLNYHSAKFILKKRSILFHVIATLFTGGIWAILYLVMKSAHSDYESKYGNKSLANNSSNTSVGANKDIQKEYKLEKSEEHKVKNPEFDKGTKYCFEDTSLKIWFYDDYFECYSKTWDRTTKVDYDINKTDLYFHLKSISLSDNFFFIVYYTMTFDKSATDVIQFIIDDADKKKAVEICNILNEKLLKKQEYEENKTIKHEISSYPKIMENSILKWKYYDVNIFILPETKIDYDELSFGINPGISFEKEPENQYDKKAIKVLYGNTFLGYLYKGQIQDMVNSYLDNEEYEILAQLNLIDKENNKLDIQIGFYKELNVEDNAFLYSTKATLIKTSKKDSGLETSRQDNYGGLLEGEMVEITEDYEIDNFVVSYLGGEIGELSASVSEKIRECDSSEIIGKVIEVTESDNGTYGAKIEIFVI